MSYPPTPELDRMKAAKGQAQAIGEFLEAMQQQRLEFCQWREAGDNGQPRYVWAPKVKKAKLDGHLITEREPNRVDVLNGDAKGNPEYEAWSDGYVPDHKSIEKRLAEYFDIDLEKCEQERMAVLEHIRTAHISPASLTPTAGQR